VRVTGQDNLCLPKRPVRVFHKPWGVSDLQPWSSIDGGEDDVGELWFERADERAPMSTLLLNLLFTSEPLSIQVHPDDTFPRAMGLPNGKSEALYIISARPGAQIGVGLTDRITPQELPASIRNGSIVELAQWRPVATGDVIFIPAGTIHAIGTGIVLAETQQRSDTTFRLFDYRRQRELHEETMAWQWPTPGRFDLHTIRPALRMDGRFWSRANILFSSGSTCPRSQAGRCWPNRKRGFTHAKVLAAPLDRDKAERARNTFVGCRRLSTH
jgi:hypothetical protein